MYLSLFQFWIWLSESIFQRTYIFQEETWEKIIIKEGNNSISILTKPYRNYRLKPFYIHQSKKYSEITDKKR